MDGTYGTVQYDFICHRAEGDLDADQVPKFHRLARGNPDAGSFVAKPGDERISQPVVRAQPQKADGTVVVYDSGQADARRMTHGYRSRLQRAMWQGPCVKYRRRRAPPAPRRVLGSAFGC